MMIFYGDVLRVSRYDLVEVTLGSGFNQGNCIGSSCPLPS